MLVASAVFCFLMDLFPHLAQLSHLKSYKENQFDNVLDYKKLNKVIDSTRLDILKLCTSCTFAIFLFLLIGCIYNKTDSNYLFLLISSSIEFLFVTLPFSYLEVTKIDAKYNSNIVGYTKSDFLKLLMDHGSLVLGQALGILFLSCFARCTHLEVHPDENDAQTNQFDPNENTTPVQPQTRKCRCAFWMLIPTIAMPGLFLLTAYLPDIMMNSEPPGTYKNVSVWDKDNQILKLSEKVGFPYNDIHISHSIRDANSPNAYFSGIITKKVMITNTLMEVLDIYHVSAVVGHELGHYKHNDIVISLLLMYVNILLVTFVVYVIQKKGLSELGLSYKMPVAIVLFVSITLFKPVYALYRPIFNAVVRHEENRADCFAANLGLPIGEALTGLFKAVHQTFDPSPFFVFVYHNHPSLSERLSNIAKCKAK